MQERLLRIKEVMERTGLAKSTVWKKSKDKEKDEIGERESIEIAFPRPIKQSSRVTVWIESEINEYIAEVIKKSIRE